MNFLNIVILLLGSAIIVLIIIKNTCKNCKIYRKQEQFREYTNPPQTTDEDNGLIKGLLDLND